MARVHIATGKDIPDIAAKPDVNAKTRLGAVQGVFRR